MNRELKKFKVKIETDLGVNNAEPTGYYVYDSFKKSFRFKSKGRYGISLEDMPVIESRIKELNKHFESVIEIYG